jgi:HSP20 family protein
MPQRDPFDDLKRFLDQLTRNVESGLPDHGPSVDLRDEGDEFVLVADLPGYEKSDIEVSVADRTVTVRAEREAGTDEESDRYLRRERRHRAASRRVTVPAPVDETDASATYRNGVLTVHLPKREGGDGTEIDVE